MDSPARDRFTLLLLAGDQVLKTGGRQEGRWSEAGISYLSVQTTKGSACAA